jgi:hypothetical protein
MAQAQTVKNSAVLTSGFGPHAAAAGQPLYNGSGLFLVSAANGQLTALPVASGNGGRATPSTPLMTIQPPHQYVFQNAQGPPILMPIPQAEISRHAGHASSAGDKKSTSQVAGVKPSKAAPSILGKRPAPDLSGKHIIVDIAETAVEMFPYAKVAKRHNQPVEKVKSIFEAVVAAPLLRVPTDKRRAAKLGQDRVKAYNTAKKELEKQNGAHGNGAEGQEGLPSLFEISRSMGPSEPPLEWAHGFPGPW